LSTPNDFARAPRVFHGLYRSREKVLIFLSLRGKIVSLESGKGMQAKTEHGFTLVELLIVIAIIAILATFAYPVFISMQERANITKDMNNLRQIGFGAMRYLNDNDGVFFANTGSAWMNRLCPPVTSTTQYIADWAVFQSPWDTRTRAQALAQTPVSYGINNYAGALGVDTSKIINPSAFILFAPAQNPNANLNTISFQGTAATGLPGVWVRTNSTNWGTIPAGIQQRRQRISAVTADGHADNLLWTTFINASSTVTDPNADCRWSYNCSPTGSAAAATR
jgi:prepilin-type N-terminal cleavage/methylation domain-containing protein